MISCGTNKSLTSSKTNEIENVGFFKPLSYIQYIEKRNKAVFSDSLSAISQAKVDSLLKENKTAFRLSDEILTMTPLTAE